MVKLEGTEKQVQWGEQVRSDALRELKSSIDDGWDPRLADIIVRFCGRVTSAKWWIDNRHLLRTTADICRLAEKSSERVRKEKAKLSE
ncbi:MAG: hypothetical protein EPN45_13545 [Rhizobiaceae bacterium]|nr:MAG: hypothetical protein EPN45_13545 [Rhizobiaceae bacterium]